MKNRPWLIGVFGSAGSAKKEQERLAQSLGKALGKRKVTVITGACPGLPAAVAIEAKRSGAKVWGFAPTKNHRDLVQRYNGAPHTKRSLYDKLTYIPANYEFIDNGKVCFKYRNVTSTATCDAGIIIAGRTGTLNEYTNLADFGKIIGVLKGTGGAADMIPAITRKFQKKNGARIISNSDPRRLVEAVLKELEKSCGRSEVSYD